MTLGKAREVLGVTESASESEIERSYRVLFNELRIQVDAARSHENRAIAEQAVRAVQEARKTLLEWIRALPGSGPVEPAPGLLQADFEERWEDYETRVLKHSLALLGERRLEEAVAQLADFLAYAPTTIEYLSHGADRAWIRTSDLTEFAEYADWLSARYGEALLQSRLSGDLPRVYMVSDVTLAAYYHLGRALNELERHDDAYRVLEKALNTVHPWSGPLAQEFAQTCLRRKDYELAEQIVLTALEGFVPRKWQAALQRSLGHALIALCRLAQERFPGRRKTDLQSLRVDLLDRAEAAFVASQELEPNGERARDDLQHLRRLRQQLRGGS